MVLKRLLTGDATPQNDDQRYKPLLPTAPTPDADADATRLRLPTHTPPTTLQQQYELQAQPTPTPLPSTSISLLVRHAELQDLSRIYLWIGIAAIIVFATQLVSLLLLLYPHTTSATVFHNLEFGSAFAITLVQMLSMLYSPGHSDLIAPWLVKTVVFLNLCTAAVAFLLVAVNLGAFEILAHEIEYASSCFMAAVDAMMSLRLAHVKTSEKSWLGPVVALLTIMVAVAELGLYNGEGFDERGKARGEARAHYLEFFFEMLSSAITYTYSMQMFLRCKSGCLAICNLQHVNLRDATIQHPDIDSFLYASASAV